MFEAEHHLRPFPHFGVSEVLPERALPSVEARFHLSEAWHRRDGSFYACHLRDITDGVDPQLRGRLASRMAEVLGQPLCGRRAQRLSPGRLRDRFWWFSSREGRTHKASPYHRGR